MALSSKLSSLPGIACILGPTGSGKNDLALRLSENFPVHVVNFDSRQVYRHLAIITAQPAKNDLHKCPHHLYGFLEPYESMTAGRFVELARECIFQVKKTGGLPVLVGGTGLYLRALARGLAPIPEVPGDVRREVQALCGTLGPEKLHRRLQEIDPCYASRISIRDRQRITRALEVYQATGRTMSSWHENHAPEKGIELLKLGLELEWEQLVQNIWGRIELMVSMGAVEEVRRVWTMHSFDKNLPGLTCIGCREIIEYLEGRLEWEECLQKWFKSTRDYARRQLTWFRKEPGVHWLKPHQAPLAAELLRGFIRCA